MSLDGFMNTKKIVPISIRFPSEITECIKSFCKRKVRKKTDVVNVAVWHLFTQTGIEIEEIFDKYGESCGRISLYEMELEADNRPKMDTKELGKNLRQDALKVRRKRKSRAG